MEENSNLEATLRDYLEIVAKRKTVFVVGFIIALIGSIAVIFLFVPLKYRATTEIMIGSPVTEVVDQQGTVYIRGKYDVAVAFELMRSDIIPEKISKTIEIEEKVLISPGEVKGMIAFIAASAQRTKNPYAHNLILISAIHTDTRKAYLVAKAAIKILFEETRKYRKRVIKEMYDALSSQLLEKHRQLEESERELTRYIIDNDIIAKGIEVGSDLKGGKPGVEVWRGPQINEKYLALKSQRLNEEQFLEEVKKNRQQDEVVTLSIISKKYGGLVDEKLRDELYEKERVLSKLLLTQSEMHPDAVEAKGEVDEAKKKISMELDRALQSLDRSSATLKREEEKLRTLIKEGLSDKMVEYSSLHRDVEVKQEIYNSVVKQVEELDTYEKLLSTGFLKVVRSPIMPRNPENPRSGSCTMAFFFSILCGIACVFLFEVLDISIRNVEDVEDIIGITMLAAIPSWEPKTENKDAKVKSAKRQDAGLVVARNPKSIMGEAFRTLRTNIKFVCVDKNIKSIVITSVGPKEGKSFISSNLALSIANSGEKVILIDADLRRPTIHKYFGIENQKGLSNLLIGDGSLDEFEAADSAFENLKIIPAGPIPPNPNEILGTRRMEEILEHLKGTCNIIIIDSPPLLTVSDALILAKKTDGVIFTFFTNKTAKKAGKRAVFLLKNAGINMLGGVLNYVKTSKGGYYYYYYSYEYYADKNDKKKS
ncbi:MAG: hypothetical protein COS99_01465 [Candidatus Omnitrophica bacterium CG07_land_8_20_14_0_80_42_15]|uniref:non-specific protein-tyrosine kinase n=1 Tax=Candidatus Aquitaenariimonas noxiae TaxID=1974741 RepID=A0A2J0KUN7_9BACT|nr:MAG: hypothetical protein COS99_01465 [Candidatus Omnitrophica bacterium CG07_land_8_20_14_0_80_42_15]